MTGSGRMLPGERLDLDVEVHVDDTWWPGVLEHRRQVGDQWEGFVRWSTGPGENRIGWYPFEQLRQVTLAAESPAAPGDAQHAPEPTPRPHP